MAMDHHVAVRASAKRDILFSCPEKQACRACILNLTGNVVLSPHVGGVLMQALSSVRGCVTTVLGFALTGLFGGLLTPFTASAQPTQQPPTQAAPAQPDQPVPPAARDEWEKTLART